MRLVLASASPARRSTLINAGLYPEPIDSGVDEQQVGLLPPDELAQTLARMKAEAVAARLTVTGPTVVLGCDSILELDGKVYGKPHTAEASIMRWYRMRGRQGVLHTGHHVILLGTGEQRSTTRLGSTSVRFSDLTDAEIAAYAATGEPEKVAGAFTIDGYGGAFVTRIEGDPHNVVGVSLPLLRQMLLDLGIAWYDLWKPDSAASPSPVGG